MGTINSLYESLKSLNLRKEVPKIVQQTSYEIIALNQQQLNQGLGSDGKKIKKRYKSASYAKKKNQMNPIPGYGVADLRLTGSYYKGMGVVIKGNTYSIDSVDAKAARLEKDYPEGLGLTDDNKTEYAKGVLFNGIKSYIESKTGLKFR